MIIPPAADNIISQINNHGFEAFLVGGCVRDILMKKPPHDWDIATSATPAEIQKIFSSYTVIPTGIKHGTVTVIVDKIPFEITTFRIDGSYKDNRHPESVTFSTSITDDLKRRDFTMNAIAYNPDKGIVDPYCGQLDLKDRIIRAVGDPTERFSEDALRIMRAIRFSAVLGFEIEPTTADILYKFNHLLEHIAAERITEELNKILCSNGASTALEKYFSVISHRLFGINSPHRINNSVFNSVCRMPCVLSLRLTAFLFCVSKLSNTDINFLAKMFFSNLKYDNKTRHLTITLVKNLHREIPTDKISIRRIIGEIGADTLGDIFELRSVLQLDDSNASDDAKNIFLKILKDGDCCNLSNLNISGKDLATEFNLSGIAIGNALNFLLDAVIKDKCPNERLSLLEYFKKVK